MCRKLLYLLLLFGVTGFAQSFDVALPTVEIRKSNNTTFLFFEGASYNNDFIPFVRKKVSGHFKVSFSSVNHQAVSAEIESLLKELHEESILQSQGFRTYENGNPVTVIDFYPWKETNGKWYFSKTATIELEKFQNKNFQFRKQSKISQSALANNSWAKFSVTESGVHQLTYDDLLNSGIINGPTPSNQIIVLSNYSRMLPFINNEEHMDDLTALPLKINDGGDGELNPNDNILFYTEANGHVYKDGITNLFKREINLYSDSNFVFVGINGSLNSEIQLNNSLPPPIGTVYDYTKVVHHENEWLNFIKSGRIWVGEPFENNPLSFSLDYNPPLVESPNASFEYKVCARSSHYTDNIISLVVNEDTISSTQINKVSSIYYNDYVKFGQGNATQIIEEDTLGISFFYKQEDNPLAWLDYFSVNSVQRLSLEDQQLFFRNAINDGVSYYFNVNGDSSATVWDVTYLNKTFELPTTKSDTGFQFRSHLDTLRTIVAFTEDQIKSPKFEKTIQPQNLHGETSKNYIIITVPIFEEEAKRLIQLHQEKDGLSGQYYFAEEIFNEYSCGRPEATAIRNFIRDRYLVGQGTSDSLQYVLLLGDGSYDPKNRIIGNVNYIPTFQSANSTKLTSSYVSDDIYGLLDENEGEYSNGDQLDIGVGRFPVKYVGDAKNIVDKIYEYYDQYDVSNVFSEFEEELLTSKGSWKNKILFVADDEDFNEHMKQADKLATMVDTGIHELNIKKIYLDSYEQESSISGYTSPEAKTALAQGIKEGTLLINYTGHGGELGWTEEKLLETADIFQMDNRHNLPLFMTATCEFSRFDDPIHTSAGEHLILKSKGGAIGLFTTVRLVFSIPNFKLNQTFYDVLKGSIENSQIRLGDVFRLTKVENNGGTNDRNFTLLGDPALKLGFPSNNAIIDSITLSNVKVDTLEALSNPTIVGHIENKSGSNITGFNGWAEISIFDKKANMKTLDNDNKGLTFEYKNQEDLLFRGRTLVENGKFSIETFIPKEIRSNYDLGKISIYAIDSTGLDATGYSKEYFIGGTYSNYSMDNQGPEIEVYLEDTTFTFGEQVSSTPLFIAYLSDSSGINIMPNDIGRDITLSLNDDFENTTVLNSVYKTSKTTFKKGEILYPLDELSNGRHSLVLKAFDNHNNSSQAYTEFIIESNPELALSHVLNYPNPFTTNTGFYFEHNQSGNSLNILIQVMTISGRIVKTIETTANASNQRIGPIEWDGRDDFGDPIGRGVYIYQLSVENSNGDKEEILQKLVLLR